MFHDYANDLCPGRTDVLAKSRRQEPSIGIGN